MCEFPNTERVLLGILRISMRKTIILIRAGLYTVHWCAALCSGTSFPRPFPIWRCSQPYSTSAQPSFSWRSSPTSSCSVRPTPPLPSPVHLHLQRCVRNSSLIALTCDCDYRATSSPHKALNLVKYSMLSEWWCAVDRPPFGLPKSSIGAWLGDWENRHWALLAGAICSLGNITQVMGPSPQGMGHTHLLCL